jgi:hypothetical protein
MKRYGQVWPDIVFKFFKLAIIIDWPDQIPILTIKYNTRHSRETYFSTMILAKRIIGPVYWLKELHMEVVRDDATQKRLGSRV